MRIRRALTAIILLSLILVGCAAQPTATPIPRVSLPAVGQVSSSPTMPPASSVQPTSMATASASEGVARVLFKTDGETAKVATPVTIALVGVGVSDLYGAQVRIHYDPAAAQIQDADSSRPGIQVVPGTSFAAAASSFVAVNEVDVDQGIIEYAVTLVNPAKPLGGDIEILSFELTPLRPGQVALELSQVLLADRNANPLPVEFAGLVLQAE